MHNKLVFCHLSVIPVRAEAKDQSEIVTQLLFGEHCEVISLEEPWMKIKSLHDGYEGFIDYKQVSESSQKDFEEVKSNFTRLQQDNIQFSTKNGALTLLKGALISKRQQFKITNSKFERISSNATTVLSTDVISIAMSYLNAPYLWGGRTSFGIDCSGFTQAVLRFMGIELSRDASQQVLEGKEVTFENLTIGDLAFFQNSKGKVSHVGILMENNKIIHAAGQVRIDELREEGIFRKDFNTITHKFHSLRRYLS